MNYYKGLSLLLLFSIPLTAMVTENQSPSNAQRAKNKWREFRKSTEPKITFETISAPEEEIKLPTTSMPELSKEKSLTATTTGITLPQDLTQSVYPLVAILNNKHIQLTETDKAIVKTQKKLAELTTTKESLKEEANAKLEELRKKWLTQKDEEKGALETIAALQKKAQEHAEQAAKLASTIASLEKKELIAPQNPEVTKSNKGWFSGWW